MNFSLIYQSDSMMPFIEDIKKAGGKAITLRVNIPFHCPYMKLAAEKFAEGLKKYTFKKGTCKIISNVTAKPYEEDEDIPLLLSKQIVSPVRWIESMNYLADNDVDVILEMGPGRILNKMTQSLSDKYLVSSLDNPKDDQFSLNIFNSKKLFNRNYLIERMMGVAVSEKNNNFDEKAYEEGVVKPYNKIRSLSDELEASGLLVFLCIFIISFSSAIISLFLISPQTDISKNVPAFEKELFGLVLLNNPVLYSFVLSLWRGVLGELYFIFGFVLSLF